MRCRCGAMRQRLPPMLPSQRPVLPGYPPITGGAVGQCPPPMLPGVPPTLPGYHPIAGGAVGQCLHEARRAKVEGLAQAGVTHDTAREVSVVSVVSIVSTVRVSRMTRLER